MKPADWQQRESLFERALALPAEERPRYVEDAAGADRALADEVLGLLAAHESHHPLLDAPPADELPRGMRLGPWALERLLGSGGMSTVYLAHRADEQFEKLVAVKLLTRGLQSALDESRFRAERQILAGLEHPNIARLVDSGVSEYHQPYLVMEFVDGQPLDVWAKQAAPPLADRLEIWLKVAEAVGYAHRNLIVHRDLKPSNVIVNREGEPKLLDFGIAKLLDQGPADTATRTQYLTPLYASPEQIQGQAITTATDVYSLGVILFELAAGSHPYSAEAPHQAAEAALHQDPVIPAAIPKDLSAVIRMALRKDPSRRYQTVNQFAEDVRRYRAGLPVTAQPETLRYRVTKFVGRHRVGVSIAAGVMASLLALTVTTSRQMAVARRERARAERRFNDVRALSNSFLFEFHDAIQGLAGSTPARKLVVSTALKYLDSLSKEQGNDLSLQLELAQAYIQVGNVQGNPNNSNLGDTAGALESYRKALAIAETLAHDSPGTAGARRTLARSYLGLGDVQAVAGNTAQAVENLRKSVAIFEALSVDNPSSSGARLDLALAYLKLGDKLGHWLFPNLGDTAGALENYRKSLAVAEAEAAANPANVDAGRLVYLGHERIGDVLRARGGDLGEALERFRQSQGTAQALLTQHPTTAEFRRHVAIIDNKIGEILALLGDTNDALQHHREALEIYQGLSAADPHSTQHRRDVGNGYEKIGQLLLERGDVRGALNYYDQALVAFEALSSTDSASAQARRDVAFLRRLIGDALARRNDTEGALASYRTAKSITESIVTADSGDLQAHADLAVILLRLADLSVQAGRTGEAKGMSERGLALLKALADRHEASANDFGEYSRMLLACQPIALRDPPTALRYAQRAVEMTESRNPTILDTLALAFYMTGDREAAVGTEKKAVALLSGNSPQRRTFETNLQRFQASRSTLRRSPTAVFVPLTAFRSTTHQIPK